MRSSSTVISLDPQHHAYPEGIRLCWFRRRGRATAGFAMLRREHSRTHTRWGSGYPRSTVPQVKYSTSSRSWPATESITVLHLLVGLLTLSRRPWTRDSRRFMHACGVVGSSCACLSPSTTNNYEAAKYCVESSCGADANSIYRLSSWRRRRSTVPLAVDRSSRQTPHCEAQPLHSAAPTPPTPNLLLLMALGMSCRQSATFGAIRN